MTSHRRPSSFSTRSTMSAWPGSRSARAKQPAIRNLLAKDFIGRGHKVALKPIKAGQEVSEFGQVIGVATADIAPGEHIHLHNLAMVPSEHEITRWARAR